MSTELPLAMKECQYAQRHGQDVVIHCADYYRLSHPIADFIGAIAGPAILASILLALAVWWLRRRARRMP
jgi:hypothetical protein